MAFTKLTLAEKQRRKEERKTIKYEKEHTLINGIDNKICSECNIYKPSTLDYFYKNTKNSTDGLYNKCIECEIKRAIKWKKENPDKFAISQAKVEAKLERKISNRKRATKQRKAGKQKAWQERNPNKLLKYNQDRQHKNHKITKSEWLADKEYFKDKDGDFSCAYCGLKLQNHYRTYAGKQQKIDFHKEHVDHQGSNDLSNCVPSCGSCNDKKWKFAFNDWYNESYLHYTIERYNKIIQWLDNDYKLYIESEKPKRQYKKKAS